MVKEYSKHTTIPQAFVKGKCIGGSSDIFYLHTKNKLKPLLKFNMEKERI